MNRKEVIELLSNEIRKGNIAFFAGAGISFYSGIPTVPMILKRILACLDILEADKEMLLNSSLPFESYMECFLFHSDGTHLYNLFRDKSPNRNHFFMAATHEQTRNNGCIVTTNFDTLIEDAFAEKEHFIVNTGYNNSNETGKTNIYKIHGSITDTHALGITLRAVASGSGLASKKDILEYLFEKGKHEYVLVWGYSCSDVFDISPIIEDMPVSKKIIFIQHEFNPEYFACEDITVQSEKNPFSRCSGYRVKINTDKLVDDLDISMKFNLPENPIITEAWKTDIDQWASQPRLSKGQKNTIAGTLMKLIGNNNLSIQYLQKAITAFKEAGEEEASYLTLQNLGQSYLYQGDFENARKCLESCLSYFNDPLYGPVYSSTLNDLGGIYKQEKNYKVAMEFYRASLEVALKYNLPGHAGNRLGNIASAYFEMGDMKNSREYCNESLRHAKMEGNKRLESNMLALLAYINERENTGHTSSAYSKNAVSIAKHIGNDELALMRILQQAEHCGRRGNYQEAINLLVPIDLTTLTPDRKVMVLSKIAHQYGNLKNIEAMRDYIEQLVRISGEPGLLKSSLALIKGNLATFCYINNNIPKALDYYGEEFLLTKESGDKEHTLIALLNMSRCYKKLGDNKSTVQSLLAAEAIAIETGNLAFLGNIYGQLGDYYNEMADDKTALVYFTKSLDISIKSGDSEIDKIYDNIAKTCYNLNEYKKAGYYWNLALEAAVKNNHPILVKEYLMRLQQLKFWYDS